jgi:ATP-dependent 26S proteasome regulatory subunit
LLYRQWELARVDPAGACQAVNLFGLPGTGKTLCAEAIAAELGRGLIEVNYAEIESKYVGETPKNICQAFRQAAEQQAVLFFDEDDSILGRRLTNVTQAADQAVNVTRAVMLKQLDAFDGVVIFATNLARNFDTAFVRRILLHIEVSPPGVDERRALWQRMISPRVPGRATLDFERLATESSGLVGGDIKNAAVIGLSRLAPRIAAGGELAIDDLLAGVEAVRGAKESVGSEQ